MHMPRGQEIFVFGKYMSGAYREVQTLQLFAVGFKETNLPRQGKQPPELVLTLDSSSAATNQVLHALTLLQSPLSRDHAQSVLPSTDPQPASTQQTAHASLQSRSQQSAEDTTSRQGVPSVTDDVQVTDDTAAPVGPTEADTAAAPAAAGQAAVVGAADMHGGLGVDSASVPDTPTAQDAGASSSLLPARQPGAPAASGGQPSLTVAFLCLRTVLCHVLYRVRSSREKWPCAQCDVILSARPCFHRQFRS